MRDPIQLSALGFGCAPVMGKVSKSQAMRAMAQAVDLGVTHFDVARSYGLGRAESVLGAFIKGRREKVTVTTKFGVVPPRLSWRTQALIPIARSVANFVPHLKSRLKNKSGQLLVDRNFDVAYARQCLDESLAALGTDYIDIYLVHEPDAVLLKRPAELCKLLDDSVRDGKIRRWGFAYQTPQDYDWANALGGDVIQFEGNFATLPKCGAILDDARQMIITRPFVGDLAAMQPLAACVDELGLGPIVRELDTSLSDVALCLSRHLAKPSGSVVTSMFSAEHIQENIRAINVLARNKQMTFVVDKLATRFRIQNETERIYSECSK